MSKQVVKGWMLSDEKVARMGWSDSSDTIGICLTKWEAPVLYKYKGTTQDAIDYDYNWPPKRVTITIEVKE